jgi:hypothetical protein
MLFCPYCGIGLAVASAPPPPTKRTGFPIAGGILTIVGSCIAAFIGILMLIASAFQSNAYYYYYNPYPYYLFIGIFGILGFAFGLTAGIFSLKRRHFAFSIIGISLLLLSGFVTMVLFALMPFGSVWGGLLFGLPAMLLSLLGLIFTAISKSEFA